MTSKTIAQVLSGHSEETAIAGAYYRVTSAVSETINPWLDSYMPVTA
jgi:hypothetical protein